MPLKSWTAIGCATAGTGPQSTAPVTGEATAPKSSASVGPAETWPRSRAMPEAICAAIGSVEPVGV